MQLPDMPATSPGREFLRIGGGHGAPATGASPAGGCDIDPAGNAAMDGDLTIGGDLSAGGGALSVAAAGQEVTAQHLGVAGAFAVTGTDTTWAAFLHAADGFPTSTNGCNPLSQTQVRLLQVEFRSLDFPAELDRRALFNLVLPKTYPGGALQVELFWTCSSGASAQHVRWVVNALTLTHGDSMDQAPTGAAVLQQTLGAHQLHRTAATITPANAAAGDYLNLLLIRNGAHTSDTFDAPAQLIALRITNA